MGVFVKYPKTMHIEGSGVTSSGKDRRPWSELAGQHLVVEEKLDGTQVGISFEDERVHLQSRGNLIDEGDSHDQFDSLRQWIGLHYEELYLRLGERYIMFGEWLASKHTVFYDQLPQLLMEFDIYDRAEDIFLSTPARHALLLDSPVASVPVVFTGQLQTLDELTALVQPSLYRSPQWQTVLEATATQQQLDVATILAQTDCSPYSEGLYIKQEDEHQVLSRSKWIRPQFIEQIRQSGTHWRQFAPLSNRTLN